jgi:ABC-type nitrate/sulfonate/bicarbonate transport system substrate-binding protein
MKTLRIALDWTPNINHIGIFIAQELGYFKENGVAVEIINPLDDNYALTPGKKLELDLVDFAVAPFETVISLNNKENRVNAIAVYAILQEDLSSIASLKSSELTTPKQLDGKIYASYKARYEDKIVKELVKNDGGNGEIIITYPDKLGIWNTLIEGKADATWIFDNWEGIEAEGKNIELTKWALNEYAIPYGYSPIIIGKKEQISALNKEFIGFIHAIQKGYAFATENPVESARILNNHLTDYDKENINIEKALAKTTNHFSKNGHFGRMEINRVNQFIDWLIENNLENKKIRVQELFTNELLG